MEFDFLHPQLSMSYANPGTLQCSDETLLLSAKDGIELINHILKGISFIFCVDTQACRYSPLPNKPVYIHICWFSDIFLIYMLFSVPTRLLGSYSTEVLLREKVNKIEIFEWCLHLWIVDSFLEILYTKKSITSEFVLSETLNRLSKTFLSFEYRVIKRVDYPQTKTSFKYFYLLDFFSH